MYFEMVVIMYVKIYYAVSFEADCCSLYIMMLFYCIPVLIYCVYYLSENICLQQLILYLDVHHVH